MQHILVLIYLIIFSVFAVSLQMKYQIYTTKISEHNTFTQGQMNYTSWYEYIVHYSVLL